MITEINGFQIDVYNQHKLDEKTQGICPLCSHDRKPKNQKQSVLLMIGTEVLVRVITVIRHFNYIHIKEKARLKKYMKYLSLLRKIHNTQYQMLL